MVPGAVCCGDPPGYIDDDAVGRLRELGGVVAVAASHPHIFGVQVEWARRLGGVPVLVAAPDMRWAARPDPLVQPWRDRLQVLPGVTLVQLGGHFPGSAVVHWTAGADGRGVLLIGDTLATNPDRSSVTFMRSLPNRIPLSAAVVARTADSVERLGFDRVYVGGEGFRGGRLLDPAAVPRRGPLGCRSDRWGSTTPLRHEVGVPTRMRLPSGSVTSKSRPQGISSIAVTSQAAARSSTSGT